MLKIKKSKKPIWVTFQSLKNGEVFFTEGGKTPYVKVELLKDFYDYFSTAVNLETFKQEDIGYKQMVRPVDSTMEIKE